MHPRDKLSLSSSTSARMLALARTTAPTSSPGQPPRTTAPTHTAPPILCTTTKTTTRLLAASPSLSLWPPPAASAPPPPPPCCIFRWRSRGTAAALEGDLDLSGPHRNPVYLKSVIAKFSITLSSLNTIISTSSMWLK